MADELKEEYPELRDEGKVA